MKHTITCASTLSICLVLTFRLEAQQQNKQGLSQRKTGQESTEQSAATKPQQKGHQSLTLQHDGSVWSVAFSPSGKILASGAKDNVVRLWDAQTGKLTRTLAGHSNAVPSVAFSPDGKLVATGSWDGTVRFWETETGQLKQKWTEEEKDKVSSISFSPDGKIIAIATSTEGVRVRDIETGKLLHTCSETSLIVTSVVFSPDGKMLAIGGGTMAESGARLTLSTSGGSFTIPFITEVSLCDARTGKCKGKLQGHDSRVIDLADRIPSVPVAFSPDGRTVASGSPDETVRLWDAVTGKLQHILRGHKHFVLSVAFSPDGTMLVSSGDTSVRLWDVQTGKLQRTLTAHSDAVLSVAFSPDGKVVASGS